MLAHDHEQSLEQALAALVSRTEIPPRWFSDAEKRGPLPATPRELRRFARFYYATRAILFTRQSLPAIARSDAEHLVYTKDLSREGLAFLHFEQLFPGENMSIWLPGGAKRQVMMIRSLKLGERCYQAGACFL